MNIENEPHSGSGSTAVQRYFVREMAMVHRMFRREFLLAPGVVREVSVRDTDRAHTVAEHLRFISATLHHHHSTEDRYAWPLLKQRAPAHVSRHVVAVMQQHRRVDAVQTEVNAVLPIWSCGASAEYGERLAAGLERLAAALIEHMDYEEQHVVPLMDIHIGLDEWNDIMHAMTAGQEHNRSDTLLVVGMVMYEGDKDIIDTTIARTPPKLRAGIRCAAALAYAEHAEVVHGTATPPLSTDLRR
jgi:iron-sulfur cluster repair protein YtfE (RIC family)